MYRKFRSILNFEGVYVKSFVSKVKRVISFLFFTISHKILRASFPISKVLILSSPAVWHCGLICKLLCLFPDRHVVSLIMELVRNRSFTLTIGAKKQSRLRRLKNGVPQESVLAALMFNIYTYDLPVTVNRNFSYANSLTTLHYASDWQELKGTLIRTCQSYPLIFTNRSSSLVQQKLCPQPSILQQGGTT